MRLTAPLRKVNFRRRFKELWMNKGYIRPIPLNIPRFLEGKEIIDPTRVPEHPELSQGFVELYPDRDDPRFKPPYKPQDHPDYHDTPMYEFNLQRRLLEGERQACVLTKTQPFHQLPSQLQQRIGAVEIPRQDELIQRYIMQANVWDPTKDKLPRRINPQLPGWHFKAEWGIPNRKRNSILLRNLIRLCQTLGGRYPELLHNRRLSWRPMLSTNYMFQENKPILIKSTYDWLMSTDTPLAPFGSDELIDQSVDHALPDFYPVLPTIDLYKQHIYRPEENITGWKEGYSHRFPHTMFLSLNEKFSTSQRNAKALMFCFAQCLAQAKHEYGPDIKTLPQPISTQCIMMDGTTFHFVCFQLNTLNMSAKDGKKNLVWFDNDNAMYQKILPKRAMLRNTKYEDYDPEVFKKFIVLYMNGTKTVQTKTS